MRVPMLRKSAIITGVFLLIGALVFVAGGVAADSSPSLQAITPVTACPVTSCASGLCHDYENVPEPDGVNEPYLPRIRVLFDGVPRVELAVGAVPQGLGCEPEPLVRFAVRSDRWAHTRAEEAEVRRVRTVPRICSTAVSVAFSASMLPAATGLLAHEWLGLALVVLAIAHVVLGWETGHAYR